MAGQIRVWGRLGRFTPVLLGEDSGRRFGWHERDVWLRVGTRALADDVPAGLIGLGTIILTHNEIGTVQPVAAIGRAVHEAGGLMHADAAQAVGKIPVSVTEPDVDLLSIAGHKLYAPKGIGALYIRRGTRIAPVLVGAGQERGIRPGTENGADILAGIGDVAASTGSSCHSGVHSPSAALLAIGVPSDEALGALRLSLGRQTTADDIDRAAEALARSATDD